MYYTILSLHREKSTSAISLIQTETARRLLRQVFQVAARGLEFVLRRVDIGDKWEEEVLRQAKEAYGVVDVG